LLVNIVKLCNVFDCIRALGNESPFTEYFQVFIQPGLFGISVYVGEELLFGKADERVPNSKQSINIYGLGMDGRGSLLSSGILGQVMNTLSSLSLIIKE
jgi:hypothetical protein